MSAGTPPVTACWKKSSQAISGGTAYGTEGYSFT